MPAKYDVVINNGRVMDPETNFDSVANMGIKDGKIMAITKDSLEGMETIDATGHVVAPGFIDTHAHWCLPIGYKLAVLDGRTSLMDLELGTEGTHVNQWYKNRENAAPVNFGCGSSHEFARSSILSGFKFKTGDVNDVFESRKTPEWSSTKPNLDQGNLILDIIDKGLQAGALGVVSTLGYMRYGVSSREAFEACKVAAAWNRPAAFHVRGTPGSEVDEVTGYQELLANAAALGCPAIACHFNNPGYNLVHELLTLMQNRGMNVWGELYPYTAGCTALNAVFLDKEIWVDKLGHKYEDTLQDPTTGKFFTKESRDEMLKKDPIHPVVLYKMPESCIVEWLRLPNVAIATDSVPLTEEINGEVDINTPLDELPNTHPRGAGAYAKALRMAREHEIPLMQVVSQTSYNTAKRLGMCGLKSMQERGRMQVGCVADIAIFNPETVTDKATYAKGCIPSAGIPYVLVNGTIVVKKSELLKVYPGQPIRFEPKSKGRFDAISVDKWKHNYTVTGADMGGCGCCGPLLDNKFLPEKTG